MEQERGAVLPRELRDGKDEPVQRQSGKDGALGNPTELFNAGIVGAGGFDHSPNFLISPDGQRILAVTRAADEPDTPLTVIVNWKAPASLP